METSNLREYSANHLKLLLRGVNEIIKEEQSSIIARRDMLNGDDLSDEFIDRQVRALNQHGNNLGDLEEMKIALMYHLDQATKVENLLKN